MLNYKFFVDFLRYKKYQYIIKKNYNSDLNYNRKDSNYHNYINQLKTNGFAIIENFVKKEDCNKTIQIINKFIDENPKLIWKDEKESDTRIHGAENISHEFFNLIKDLNNFTKNIGKLYLNQDIDLFMVMANRTLFKNNNLGSGSGWHKDSYSKQFKSILYLNDVSKGNGPFQFIKKSNEDFFMLKLFSKIKNKFPSTRFSDSEINLLLNDKKKNCIKEIVAEAGTLILVDTSFIHRGKPLEQGTRYALTNYFFPKSKFKDHQDHFLPILTKIEKEF